MEVCNIPTWTMATSSCSRRSFCSAFCWRSSWEKPASLARLLPDPEPDASSSGQPGWAPAPPPSLLSPSSSFAQLYWHSAGVEEPETDRVRCRV